ncbi:MAG: bifunctional UDP-N-acetylglucosamine diphosphorylase/glucosamine-1-phosphate N-acetyltransferase GlmU [bacterium]|nr:bifunctional UDP-N-acetylglucosamine diphosphorylase/glucosamine-1-phosphate N-acetyltransferase GlmU [bacterium]
MGDICTVILAAGKGSRMRSKTPKVLHKVGGLPLVHHATNAALSLKPKKTVLVLAQDLPDVISYTQENISHAHVAFQDEQKGTAHALLCARKHLENFQGTVLVLFGDTPLIRPGTLKKLAVCCEKGSAVTVLGMELENPGHYGRLVTDGQDKLQRIVEYKDATPQIRKITLCNSGVMAFDGRTLLSILDSIQNKNQAGEFYLTDAVAIAQAKGLKTSFITSHWAEVQGVNSKSDLAQVEKTFQMRRRQDALDSGVTLIDPESTHFSHDTYLAQDTVIHPHVVFHPGVHVEAGAEIREFTSLEETRVGAQSIVGPFARLRPGTVLKKEVRIGNFVEVKKSTIDKGAKVNHLSYIGDAKIGEKANIGAGTITCNYDGASKWPTHIESGVFIGSNTALVAPVTVGKDAIVGAGSTIVRDVPRGAVSLARSEQIIKEDAADRLKVKRSLKIQKK